MFRPRAIALAVALPLILGAGLIACGGDDDGSEPKASAENSASADSTIEAPTEIVGGRSLLKLDPELKRVLRAAQVEISPVGDASDVAGGIRLPITTGEVDIDTPSGEIEHAGGLEFRLIGASVRAEDLVLRPGDGVVSARVDGERIPLLNTDLGRARVIDTSDVVVLPADLTVGDQAVTALNDALGVEVFERGLHLGRLTTSAQRP